MREKIKGFFKKKSDKSSSLPIKEKFLRKRDKLAESIRISILACFNAISPVWNFLFLKTPDPDLDADEPSNQISQDVIKQNSYDLNLGS